MNSVSDRPAIFLDEGLTAGQSQLADRTRTLLSKLAPGVAERLDFGDDETFLEPLLFAYFIDPDPVVELEQILFGYLPESARPAEIPVYADRFGVIELPRIGYLRTNAANRRLRLFWNGSARLQDGDEVMHYMHQPALGVSGTSIEV